jgi:uncharacterized protein (DUF305 family)
VSAAAYDGGVTTGACPTHVARAVACVLVGGLAVAGCALPGGGMPGRMMDGPPAAARSATDHNRADVMFSMMMVPHHAQAIEMADLVPSRSGDPGLRALAVRIRDAQAPEVERMTRWLESWGVTPMADMAAHAGHMGMDGMQGADEMRELESLAGPAFTEAWLTMMIEHHEGAIDMADSVLASGRHAGTAELAQDIRTSQRAEILEMRGMLTE